MKLYRIVQDRIRTTDLSGMGAYRHAGRWNSKGTYMLYTSENSSLAYLERFVHFDETEMPPDLFIIEVTISKEDRIYTLPDKLYNPDWMKLSLPANQEQGDQWMREKKYLGIRVRSAINPEEFNCLLNPLYPGFQNLVKITGIKEISVDQRIIDLLKS